MYRITIFILILFLETSFLTISCSDRADMEFQKELENIEDSLDLEKYIKYTKNDADSVSYYVPIWAYLTKKSDYNGIIDISMPLYLNSKRRNYEEGIIYSSAYLAQIYLHYGNPDSLRIYLDELMKHNIYDSKINALINTIEAAYALNYEMDYTRAMRCYVESSKIHKQLGNPRNLVINLCNISIIFVLRQDPLGYKYAKEALDICHKYKLDSHFESISWISVAEMLTLNKNYNDALNAIKNAEELVERDGLDYLKTITYVTHAKIFKILGSRYDAEIYLKKAAEFLDKAQIDQNIDYYFNCALLYTKFFDKDKALDNYFDALRLSYKFKYVDHRGEILKGISDVYDKVGEKELSYAYMRRYNLFKDSILNAQKERDFNNYQLLLQKAEQEKLLQSKEIDLLKANRRSLILLSAFVIFAIIITFVLIYIINKNRTYAQLVKIHQKNLYKSNPEFVNDNILLSENEDPMPHDVPAETTAQHDENIDDTDINKDIFDRIEDLMKTDKLYTDKELTLEKVANRLNTNRSYVSRAINKYSGQGFFNYINTYRINEATRILSESDIPLKQLCDDVGFLSTSTFYRAFQKETGCSPSRYRSELLKLKKASK